MRFESHQPDPVTGYCAHCGQALPKPEPGYGEKRRANKTSIAVTILVHVVVLLMVVLGQTILQHKASKESILVNVMPLLAKKPQEKPQPVKKQARTPPVNIARLPNTITLPKEKFVEPVPVQEAKPVAKPVEEDMAAYIAARQKARGANQPQAPGETEAERGKRLANANIAALNGKSNGNDKDDTGGVFELKHVGFATAELKFRGFNSSFKRRWLKQLEIQQGKEIDLETAVVKKMIELIREEKKGDFIWESHRLNRNVPMSAAPEHTAELTAFLMKEMYPNYSPPRK